MVDRSKKHRQLESSSDEDSPLPKTTGINLDQMQIDSDDDDAEMLIGSNFRLQQMQMMKKVEEKMAGTHIEDKKEKQTVKFPMIPG